MIKKIIALTTVCLITGGWGIPEDTTGQETKRNAEQAVLKFINAFDNLDKPSFAESFSEDATMFLPFMPERANGLEEIIINLSRVFNIKNNSNRSGSYLGLKPVEMQVQLAGENAAVVTWLLDRNADIGRRTAVLNKIKGKWLIVHFHASNMEKE